MPRTSSFQVPFNIAKNQTVGALFKKLGFISPDEAIIPLIKYSLKMAREMKILRKRIAELQKKKSRLPSHKKGLGSDLNNDVQSDYNSAQSDSSFGCASTVPCHTCCTCFGNFVYDPNIHGIITDGCLWCFLNHGYCIGSCCDLTG